jgi:hypothetical protein
MIGGLSTLMNLKVLKAFPCAAAALLLLLGSTPGSAAPPTPAASYPLEYVGGSLPLELHKLTATFDNDQVVFSEGRHRVEVPVKEITEISCGTNVRRHFGGTVLGVVPKVWLSETRDHYIGVEWNDPARASRVQVLLKLNKSEYQQFLSALERLTGMTAVDTNRVPTVVRYSL